MSFVKIDNDVIDSLTIELHPEYKYTSKTDALGVVTTTGAINVKARGDKALKDVHEPIAGSHDGSDGSFDAIFDAAGNLEAQLSAIQVEMSEGTDDYYNTLNYFMNSGEYAINSRPLSKKNDVQIEVARFDPPFEFSYESSIKNIIKNNLMKDHITDIDHSDYSFTNYNSINFFTSEETPSDSVIMYPTPPGSGDDDHPLGRYIPEGAFSMDFYINPRYQNESDAVEFKAGTIMHLSSTFALSLVAGSQKDENGLTNAFKIMLQLSHSADVLPSSIDTTVANNSRSYPDDLIFVSEDNSLKLNNWHHVTVRWGTDTVNFGTGSIRIDDTSETYFNVPSSSITPVISGDMGDTDILFIGNYYEGQNGPSAPSWPITYTSRFFGGHRLDPLPTTDPPGPGGQMRYEGLAWEGNNFEVVEADSRRPSGDFVNPAFDGYTGDPYYIFDHPLNAEIQELKLYSKYLNTNELEEFALSNTSDFVMSGSLMFYLPPSFVKESPLHRIRVASRDFYGNTIDDVNTDNPFNSLLSFKSNTREINLENYFRDFRTGIYPKFLNLSTPKSAFSDPSPEAEMKSDDWFYSYAEHKKRNLTILPSDNGLFKPTFSHLLTGSFELKNSRIEVDNSLLQPLSLVGHPMDKFQNSENVIDLSKITLLNTLKQKNIGLLYRDEFWQTVKEEEGLVDAVVDYADESLEMGGTADEIFIMPIDAISSTSEIDVYPMYQEYRDDSSNEVTIFDITNLSYGNSIQKNTFSLYDSSLRGSGGKVNMTLKDNGRGSLYRADCLTKQATWNNVGNVFYDEGVAIVKAPTIPYFGKDQFELSLRGTQNLHVMTIDAKAKNGYINKSTNSSYLPVSSSFDVNNPDNSFVYISGINYHDENLNVIMRTNLTQPIKKKEEDEFVFRTKFDW
jgi:hypothetical protein